MGRTVSAECLQCGLGMFGGAADESELRQLAAEGCPVCQEPMQIRLDSDDEPGEDNAKARQE